jgi:hypothetical protein
VQDHRTSPALFPFSLIISNGTYLPFFTNLADVLINAEAIGEDERFRDLLANFGLPDPKDFPDLFKELTKNNEG